MPLTHYQSRRRLLRQGLMLGRVALLALGVLAPPMLAWSADTVQVCHRPPGNPSNVQLITVGQSAVAAHMRHGDTFPETFYQDADGDGYGTPFSTIQACSARKGFVVNNTDCDDTDAKVNPGAVEIPSNGIDDDCNPATPDVVFCPCESGDIVGGVRWNGFFFQTTQCSTSVDGSITLQGTDSFSGNPGSLEAHADTCIIRACGGGCAGITPLSNPAEAAACEDSLRSIAQNDSITCQ
jgi:hypothetical protein